MHLDVAAVSANRRDELPQTHCPPICHVTHRHKPQNQRKSEKGSSGRLSSSSSTGTRSKTVTSRKRRAGGSMTAGRHYVMQSGLSPRRADAGVSAGYQNWIPLSVCSLPPELRSHWLLQQLSSLLQGHTGQENQHFKNSASYKLSHMIISTGCWTPSPPSPTCPHLPSSSSPAHWLECVDRVWNQAESILVRRCVPKAWSLCKHRDV